MGFFSNLGKKVSGFVDKGISIGKKVSHATEGIAHKVSSIAGTAALGAAAIGLEPVAAGLGAVAGAAKTVELGAGAINQGLDKAEAVSSLAFFILAAGVLPVAQPNNKLVVNPIKTYFFIVISFTLF